MLKTSVEKMPVFCLSKMLMKTNDLPISFQDIHENKGERCLTRARQKATCSRSSLLESMGATVIRHGQNPDGSGQVGRAAFPRATLAHIAYRPGFRDDEPIFDERRGGTGLQPAHCTAGSGCATAPPGVAVPPSCMPPRCAPDTPPHRLSAVPGEKMKQTARKGFSAARLTRLARIHNIFAPLSPAPWIPTGRESARGRRKWKS